MGKVNIALVEDDVAINEAAALLLELSGYKVTSFLSIASFKEASALRPDLYLIDRHIGAEDGLELCTRLKENPETKDIPVVIMSASTDAEKLIGHAGCDGFVAKPFSRKQLLATITKLLPNG